MKIDIRRISETERSILGGIDIDGHHLCFSLEPSRILPVHPGHPCIPAGTYPVRLSRSPHFGYVTPEVLNVPGRSAIRIHRGNKPEDSLGCTLVGEDHGPLDWISSSAQAFEKLMSACFAAQREGEQLFVEYHDPTGS